LGKGYRVYYAKQSNVIVLLLCGGDKSTQQKDINQAKVYWQPYTQFEDWHLEKLASPSEARAYLQLALEDYENDHNIEAFLLAVSDVAKAMGSIEKLAEETNLNRQSAIAFLRG
jgi:DNA-binding phage protein